MKTDLEHMLSSELISLHFDCDGWSKRLQSLQQELHRQQQSAQSIREHLRSFLVQCQIDPPTWNTKKFQSQLTRLKVSFAAKQNLSACEAILFQKMLSLLEEIHASPCNGCRSDSSGCSSSTGTAETTNIEPPGSFICAICGDIMSDPVCIETGHAFDRHCIQKWFERKISCPKTNLAVSDARLFNNVNLRQSIQEWHIEHGLLWSPKPLHIPPSPHDGICHHQDHHDHHDHHDQDAGVSNHEVASNPFSSDPPDHTLRRFKEEAEQLLRGNPRIYSAIIQFIRALGPGSDVTITKPVFVSAIRNYGLSEAAANAIFTFFDEEQTGELEFDQLAAFYVTRLHRCDLCGINCREKWYTCYQCITSAGHTNTASVFLGNGCYDECMTCHNTHQRQGCPMDPSHWLVPVSPAHVHWLRVASRGPGSSAPSDLIAWRECKLRGLLPNYRKAAQTRHKPCWSARCILKGVVQDGTVARATLESLGRGPDSAYQQSLQFWFDVLDEGEAGRLDESGTRVFSHLLCHKRYCDVCLLPLRGGYFSCKQCRRSVLWMQTEGYEECGTCWEYGFGVHNARHSMQWRRSSSSG